MSRGARTRRTALAVIVSLGLVTTACADDATPARPDGEESSGDDITVVTNADVYTADDQGTHAEAFAFDAEGVIIAVGTEEDVRNAAGADATEIDAGGDLVLPGFQDTHVHVPEAGINEGLCFLEPNQTFDAYEEALAGCVAEQPADGWVRAAGASLFDLRDTDELPIDVLDRVVPDRPALVFDDIGHAVWVNTLALEEAGIEADAGDPPGGVYLRDAGSGELTGLLLENAQHQVRDVAAVDPDTAYAGLLTSLAELGRNGVTSMSDAGGYWPQGFPAVWERALAEDTLTVRAFNALYLYPDKPMVEQLATFADLYSNDPESLLHTNTAKIYLDGILDLGTAHLLAPYDEPPDPNFPSGFEYFDQQTLDAYAIALDDLGFQLHFHVIGDAAARSALDAVEAVEVVDPDAAEHRHRTTHTYLVDPADVPRFAELGVIADFQMATESISTDYADYLSEFIGDRAHDLIPTRTLLDAGADVSLSSDWDADELSPVGTIDRALTRPTEAVPDLETAIRLVTVDAAYALGQDDRTGTIEVGKQADFVILDQNLFDIEPEQISDTKVLLTAVGGRTVYEDPQRDR